MFFTNFISETNGDNIEVTAASPREMMVALENAGYESDDLLDVVNSKDVIVGRASAIEYKFVT